MHLSLALNSRKDFFIHISSMEISKSDKNDDEDSRYIDAPDEFPFYDAIESSSLSDFRIGESPADVITNVKALPDFHSSSGLRRRRSISGSDPETGWVDDVDAPTAETRYDSSENLNKNDQDCEISDSLGEDRGNLSSTGENIENRSLEETSMSASTNDAEVIEQVGSMVVAERQHIILRKLKEKLSENGTSDSLEFPEDINYDVESSNITTEKDEYIPVDFKPEEVVDSSSQSSTNLLMFLADLMIKAIAIQVNLLVSFFTFPLWLLYSSYVFATDPFGFMRNVKGYFLGKLTRFSGFAYDSTVSFTLEWIKERKSLLTLVLRASWGFMWAAYVCFVLISLMFSAFVVSGMITSHLIEEPIQMKETLTFDYTKNSPVAWVPLLSCPEDSNRLDLGETMPVKKLKPARIIPPNHKLQATVSLTLPESDYNRNLGIFQVRTDFLSSNGEPLATSRQPCMLQYKSQPIRLLSTSLKVVPLLTGYSAEAQTLEVKFKGFTEGEYTPTTCIKITIEQRAEFRPGSGVPEIYEASISVGSELPLPKRIVWYWRKTIFVWIAMMMFGMELLFALVCCRSIVMPKVSTARFGSVMSVQSVSSG
ncbi:seipin-2-like [Impatiens glandulifera]|uniref:seipin-2-like n=1 Tax=Impatiens glandulifera TaxID=253017 RepID=UPI001FB17FA6|nr:seipin-2-like [Impatiens glandulifera]